MTRESCVFSIVLYLYPHYISNLFSCMVWRSCQDSLFLPFGHLSDLGPLAEMTLSPLALQSQFCHKSCDCIWMSPFLDSLFCSSGLFVSPRANSHGLNCFSSIVSIDIWQCLSALCFFKIFMDVTGLRIFHINFLVTLYTFTMIDISSNLCIDLERNSFFKISSLPVYEYSISGGVGLKFKNMWNKFCFPQDI